VARLTADNGRPAYYNSPVPKWLKLMVAVLLLPFCAGAASAVLQVIRASGRVDSFWVAFIGGAACWLVVFLLLPKPMLVYVFGHELTHALWTWLFGGRVRRFKATANGGHVVTTKTNFLIVLAPYFFPLYAALVVFVFALGNLFFGWGRHLVWFHLALGAAYAFHLTLTAHILRTRQSDITSQGHLFSAVVIFLGNVSVLLTGIPLLTGRPSVISALGWWLQESGAVLHRLGRLF
jgi:hypothetical protein